MPQAEFYTPEQRQQMYELESLISENGERLQGRHLDPNTRTMRSNVDALYEEFTRSGNMVDEYYATANDPNQQPMGELQSAAFYSSMQAVEQRHANATNNWLSEGLRVERGVQNALNTHDEQGMDRLTTMVVVTPDHLGQGNSSSRSRSSRSGQGRASSSTAPSSKKRRR